MSNLRVITGENITNISQRMGEIKKLEFEIEKKLNITDRDLVVYAYHFVRLEHPLLAQKYLNQISLDYFDIGVYKDMSRALIIWAMMKEAGRLVTWTNPDYEYFVILKRVTTTFEDLHFTSKPA